MKKTITTCLLVIFCFSASALAQIPVKTLVSVVKAEDELRFDKTLIDLLNGKDAKIRARAALAAGRIGDDAAVPVLANLLQTDKDAEVRGFAAFALGEIEQVAAADAVLKVLNNLKDAGNVRARAVEAAGKIAAANPKEAKSKELGEAIINALEFEANRRSRPNGEVILHGLTAVLRVRPENGDVTAARFLTYSDGRIRADAANTLTRIRAKNANDILRKMLVSDDYAIARANAARALGAAEDAGAVDLLIAAATTDVDLRVRISSIRALGSLKIVKSADKLSERGEKLLADYKKPKFANPPEKNELLEIATALGNILKGTDDEKADAFLDKFRQADNYTSPETEIALAKISPNAYVESLLGATENAFEGDWRKSSAAFQGLGEIVGSQPEEKTDAKLKARILLIQLINLWSKTEDKDSLSDKTNLAIPDLLRAFAALKSETTSDILRPVLVNETDLFVRAAAADILGQQTATDQNIKALQVAFSKSLLTDRDYNDAQLSILSALVKLDKTRAIGQLATALDHYDYLVRRHAANLIKDNDLVKDFPKLGDVEAKVGSVKPYDEKFKSKLGQVLNSEADYTRAVSRKNGTVKAVFTTEKGNFTINFLPEDAPLTVDNFVKLAKSGYFNGVAFHRVVPNFVVQDGDPRGDGNGGPGWSIRDEMNTVEYERGAVGMALSGKNTGGSQWFVTHSPQPHLDGGYTVFGNVSETDMKIVDMLVRGDKILKVEIIETPKSKK